MEHILDQVDIAPAERQQLRTTKPRQHEREEHGFRLRVLERSGNEPDLDRLQDPPLALPDLRPLCTLGGVRLDKLLPLRRLEDEMQDRSRSSRSATRRVTPPGCCFVLAGPSVSITWRPDASAYFNRNTLRVTLDTSAGLDVELAYSTVTDRETEGTARFSDGRSAPDRSPSRLP